MHFLVSELWLVGGGDSVILYTDLIRKAAVVFPLTFSLLLGFVIF